MVTGKLNLALEERRGWRRGGGGGNVLIFDSINKTEEEFLPSLSLRSEESSKFKYERSSWSRAI